ncbi:MAG TPA: 2OG-Fe(II) oxygenase [Bacteroidia bacterium]|nr:2OG-Fe(II) oxygenase [Bacteroidia bacterium]
MAVIRPFRSLPPIVRKEYNYDFVDYMWYNGLFNPDEVERIRDLWKPELAANAKVNSGDKDLEKDKLRQSEIMFIKPGGNEWIYDRLSTACLQANAGRYKFDITGFQTELQLASYGTRQFFDWHMDFGTGDLSNRKLSITVQLSDPDEYEGGWGREGAGGAFQNTPVNPSMGGSYRAIPGAPRFWKAPPTPLL